MRFLPKKNVRTEKIRSDSRAESRFLQNHRATNAETDGRDTQIVMKGNDRRKEAGIKSMYYQAELGFEENFNCRILQGAEAVESCAHEELELQMCVEGSARATVGGVEYAIRSGDIVLIPCNVEHSAETDG